MWKIWRFQALWLKNWCVLVSIGSSLWDWSLHLVSGKGFFGFQDSEVDVTCLCGIIFTKQLHSYFTHFLICSFVIFFSSAGQHGEGFSC